MSYLSTLLTKCPDLQGDLDQYFATNGTGKGTVDEAMPFTQFVVNNTGGIEQLIHPSANKLRTVELLYTQFIQEDQVTAASATECTASTQRGDCSKTYEIDPTDRLHVEEQIPEASLRENCKDNAMYFLERINSLINVMDRKVATKTTDDAVALMGAWSSDVENVDGTGNLEVETLRSGTTDELAPYAMEDIELAKNISQFNANTLIVGGQDLYKYYRRVQHGCCANQGVDIGEMVDAFGFAAAWDKRVVAAAGGNQFSWAVQAGSLQLLQWTNSNWKEGAITEIQESSNYESMVVRSPKTGIRYDLKIKDDCEVLHLNLYATTKIVSVPDDMFPTGSDYDGVKFFAPIEVVNT